MNKNNVDIIVGSTILVALAILISGVLWLKEVNVTKKMARYCVVFPDVGTLQEGDPVLVNGMRKGQVEKIALQQPNVVVTISIDRNVRITDSSSVRIQNIGLMGERCVGIRLSSQGTPYQPNSKDNKRITYIKGYFDSGIAEAMGMMGTVLSEVETMILNLTAIINATVGDTAFIMTFRSIVKRLDTTVKILENIAVISGPEIQQSIHSIKSITGDLKTLIDRQEDRIDAIVANGLDLSKRAVTIATRADTLVNSLQILVNRIQDGEGAAGMVLTDEQFKEKLRQTITNLDTLLNDMQNSGLPVKLKIFGGSKKRGSKG